VNLHELKWSPAEKGIARKVFDQALQRELDAIKAQIVGGFYGPTKVVP
jgi:hypothetical protein